ncbi:hypothetical protein Q1695_009564 [Nippostrongylus brasiliensis]|nr:hypothetical protein Q1695_009564 [Nippostrongylus brasiliensis]
MCEEACFIKPGPKWLPRLMVIDGCNIGRSACGMGREAVNCAGLMAVIRWLLVRDFDVVAFLPVVYNNSHNFNAVHVHLLAKLEELGLVTFTPARTGRGDRKAFINYDDLYVTTLAARHGGCVLSGDKFKDILAQSTYSEFHPVIINRTLDVKFRFLPHEVVHHGMDIFYRALPELFIYEDISTRASTIAQKIFASPDDPEFSRVLLRRESWSEERKEERLSIIDDMIAELCERNAIRPLALEHLPGYQMEPYDIYGEEIEEVYDEPVFDAKDYDPRAMELRVIDDPWMDVPAMPMNPPYPNDFSLIDFSDGFSSNGSTVLQSQQIEPPMDPFDVLTMSSGSENSWDSGSSVPGDIEGSNSRYLINEEDGQLKSAYSQEDVLKEIVAHIDTLITTRDRLTRKDLGPEQRDVGELISFFDDPPSDPVQCTELLTVEREPLESSLSFRHTNETADNASVSQQWPSTNALSEEEISYSNTPHDDDTDFKKAIIDSKIETVLSSIFPADIVQHVLAVNASRNIDFLADQCAQMCA